PCCILQQTSKLGNIYKQSLREIWHGEGYRQIRSSLARILREKETWELDPATDQKVDKICGPKGGCPIASFYYWPDSQFLNSLNGIIRRQTAPASRRLSATVLPATR
ncbi:MAG: SPASM domain-containing protein, partial [Thermoanaerobaculia bacterium]